MKTSIYIFLFTILFLPGCDRPKETKKCPIHNLVLKEGYGKLPKGMTVSWKEEVYDAMDKFPYGRHDSWNDRKMDYCELCENEVDKVIKNYPQVYQYRTTYKGTYDELEGKDIVYRIIFDTDRTFAMELDNVNIISPPMMLVDGKTVESKVTIVIAKGIIKGSWTKEGTSILFNVDENPWTNISSDFPFLKENGQVKGQIEGKFLEIFSSDKGIIRLKKL